MKKNKLMLVVTLILALALSVFVSACGNEAVTYKVTTEYDNTQGNVSVVDSKGNAASKFAVGAKAVVTVTPADGYAVDSFNVNGVDAALTDGSYEFNVVSNTLVRVTFKIVGGGDKDPDDDNDPDDDKDPDDDRTPAEKFAEAYKSVTATFKATGEYEQTKEGEATPAAYRITTVFGEKAVHILETSATTGEVLFDDVYVDVDGKIALPYHTLDNKIDYYFSDDDEDFADYGNPFKLLTATDFAATDEDDVFELSDDEKAKAAATAVTGYEEKIASFTLKIADGKVTKIDIVTDRIERGSGDDKYFYVSEYSFTVSEWDKAVVDAKRTSPYATEAEHTALKTALQKAAAAKNYTLGIHEEESGYDDLDYNVYVTQKAIYDDCYTDDQDWRAGYVQMSLDKDDPTAELVYSFSIGSEEDGADRDGKVLIGDAVNYDTIADMRADFGGFAPEIFELNDAGAYVLREECNTAENIRAVLVHFADGADNIQLYSEYTLGVAITLKDGALYQVELYYYVYGALVKRTVTYSAFDTTQMPISFDDYVKVSVLDDYVGTYTDGNIVVKITSENITVNNRPFVITDYSVLDQMFTGTYNDTECYIISVSQKQLAVQIGKDVYVVTNTEIEPVTVPAAFNGVWTDDKGNSVTVAYNKVMFGANMLKVLSYDETDGLVAVRGKTTYRMAVTELSGKPVLAVRTLDKNLMSAAYTLNKDADGAVLPEDFVGTYAAFRDMTDYKVVVTLNGVFVTVGQTTAQAESVAVNDDNVKGTVICFDIGATSYVIAHQAYGDGINLAGGSVDVNLPKVEDDDPASAPDDAIVLPEVFYGDYMYVNIADKQFYSLSIDKNGIVAAIDMSSNEYTAEITEYDEKYDNMITVKINGDIYYLFGEDEQSGVYTAITLLNEDGTVEVKLTRDGIEPDPGPDDPAATIAPNFVGTYEGTRNEVKYVLTVTADGMTVKIGDGNPVKVIIKSFESAANASKFNIVLSGTNYATVTYMGDFSAIGDEPVQKLYLTGDGNVILNRVEVAPPDPTVEIPEMYIGTFEGMDSGTYVDYKAVITADGVTLTVGGTEYEATKVEVVHNDDYDLDEVVATVNGKEYTFSEYYGNLLMTCGSVNVTLRKTEGGDDPDPSTVEMPDDYIGTFEGADSFVNKTVKVIIASAESIEVYFDGEKKTAVIEKLENGYSNVEVFVIVDEVRYVFTEYGGTYSFGSVDDAGAALSATLTKSTGDDPATVTIPDAFVGTYKGSKDSVDYTIVITKDGITVTAGSAVKQVTVDAYSDYEGFTVTMDDATYYITNSGYGDTVDGIAFMSEDYRTLNVVLNREVTDDPATVTIPDAFVGTYKGSKDSVDYTIVITKDGITVTAGSAVKQVTVDAYSDYEGFTVTMDDATYYITNSGYGDTVDGIAFMSEDYRTLNVVLNREVTDDPTPTPVEIPERFVGTFEGEDSYSHVTVKAVITTESVTITLNGGTPIDATDINVAQEDDGWGGKVWTVSFKLDGKEYAVTEGYTDDTISFASVFDNYNTQANLSRVQSVDPTPTVTIPEKFYGSYMGNAESVYYFVAIDATGVFVTLADGEEKTAVVTEYGDYFGEYINITVDGANYGLLDPVEDGGKVKSITLLSEDGTTLNVTLTRYAD